jgi:hypothetical protein
MSLANFSASFISYLTVRYSSSDNFLFLFIYVSVLSSISLTLLLIIASISPQRLASMRSESVLNL